MTRTERSLDRRGQILEAAKKLFLSKGFVGTSTDAIVGAAGIASKETLYRYFPSKEELFVAVIRSMTTEGPFLGRLLQTVPDPKTAEELRTLLRSAIAEILSTIAQPEYLALMMVTVAALPSCPVVGELFREAVPERALGYVRGILERAQAAGVARRDRHPEAVARMLIGTVLTYGIFDGLLLKGRRPSLPGPEAVDEIVANILDVVLERGNGN